ncbi:MAG: BPL-N domain-containing protein [Rickettsiaceae bacterium]|nr:BPL-N domain-containing protein [Rickettsiaceae bacterium]
MHKNYLEVKIYNGPGTSKTGIKYMIKNLQNRYNNIKITLIGYSDFQDQSILAKCDLFMILGGRDMPYTRYLNGLPNLIIKNYVLNGGNYLGICAGAYYSCARVVFAENTNQEVIGERELKFYEGECKGPILSRYYYNSKRGTKAAQIGILNFLSQSICSTYIHYNGGGTFIDPEKYQNVEVLARYLDLANSPAAIIKINYGKGKVVLSGVHFEYCNSKTHPYAQKKCASFLRLHNNINNALFDYIFNIMGTASNSI